MAASKGTGRRIAKRVVSSAAHAAVISTAATMIAGAALAQTSAQEDLDTLRSRLEAQRLRLDQLERTLMDQERRMLEDRRQLAAERSRLEALLGSMTGRGAAQAPSRTTLPLADLSVPQAAPAPMVIAQAQQQAPQPAPQKPSAAPPDKPVGEAPKPEAPRYAQIFETPGVLTPRGRLIVEPAFQYIRSTDNRIALVGFTVIPAITIGLIDIRRVARDNYYGIVTTRYGLTNRLEVEAKLPYVAARSTTITRPVATPSTTDSTFDAKGSGIGDVEFGLRYQLNEVQPDKPVFVSSLRLKTRTGTSPFEVPVDPTTNLQTELATGSGFYGLAPGFTALIPSDPAVFFGGVSYMYNFQRDVGSGFGRVHAGNVFDVNLGMGLALNERASFSIGYQHSVVTKSTQRDNDPTKQLSPGVTQQLGTLRFGTSFRIDARQTVNFTLGIGVTKDSPDVELTFRMPFTL